METENDAALEAQQELAERCLADVFSAYDEAKADGVPDAVVFVIDCDDEIGASIARALVGDEAVDDALAIDSYEAALRSEDAAQAEETIPTVLVVPVEFALASQDTPELFPYLAEAFAAGPPPGGVMVVSITAGGASALTAPWDARH